MTLNFILPKMSNRATIKHPSSTPDPLLPGTEPHTAHLRTEPHHREQSLFAYLEYPITSGLLYSLLIWEILSPPTQIPVQMSAPQKIFQNHPENRNSPITLEALTILNFLDREITFCSILALVVYVFPSRTVQKVL